MDAEDKNKDVDMNEMVVSIGVDGELIGRDAGARLHTSSSALTRTTRTCSWRTSRAIWRW